MFNITFRISRKIESLLNLIFAQTFCLKKIAAVQIKTQPQPHLTSSHFTVLCKSCGKVLVALYVYECAFDFYEVYVSNGSNNNILVLFSFILV